MAHIFWDFDGTLVRSSPLWRRAMVRALDLTVPGHNVTLEHLKGLVAGGFPWHSDETHDLVTTAKWWAHMSFKFVDDYESLGIDRQRAVAAAGLIRESILDPGSYEVFPEVPEVLTTLRKRGWTHVILSNNHPELKQVVEGLGLRQHFEEIITSATVGVEKPRSEIFEHARQLVKADFSRSWMIGDSVRADIAGAEGVGLPAILVRNEGPAKFGAGDLWEVARMIEERSGYAMITT